MKHLPPGLNFKLRTKITLLIEILVVIIVLVTGLIATNREKKTLESELQKRGLALTADLAKFMVRPLLSNDLPTLRRFVNHSMEQDYVLFIMVLDPQGKVVMHSNLSEINKIYDDGPSILAVRSKGAGYTYKHKHLSKEGEMHCHIFSPIEVSGTRLGTIHLGYSYEAVENEIAKAQKQIFIVGLITTIIGGVLAYILATFISSPIKSITKAIAKVANGGPNTPLTIKRNDEIGTLATAFNTMIEDLRRTTVSKDYIDNIIGSMNEALVVFNPDSKIRSVNKATCHLLGYKEGELIGKDLFVIMQPKKNSSPSAKNMNTSPGFHELLSKGPVMNREIDYKTKSGKTIPMLFSASALKDKNGLIEGAVAMARDVTERKRAEEALRKSEKELHFLSSQLLTAQEKERRRLSRELHDELGQALIIFKFKLRSILGGLQEDQGELKKGCEELINYINEVTENVRRLSRDLSPSVLEDLGLSAAIRWLAESFTKHFNIHCSLEMTEVENLFPSESQITLYRIIQECLTNIAKHAQASQVSMAISEKNRLVFFHIEDDGKGFNLKEVLSKHHTEKGLGLATMSERIRMLGGAIDIWSKEGTGTKIAYTIPVNTAGKL